jgi:hypothetical protein
MTNPTENIKQGERLSFYQLIQDKKYHIEIPIIQRDYAQGRSSFAAKRKIFLNALKTYLEENKPNRDLDFIYGTIERKIFFVPLDGQQRLTTLFLLHWYLALKDGKIEEFRQLMTSENNSKFRYKTRASSTDFFDALLQAENQIDLTELTPDESEEYPTIASIIEDCGWYFDSWKKDPTVQSILVMMDSIHQIFNDCTNYFERLTNPNQPIITFMFLNIGEYGLTDDLYIKMNSRGKPLTPFENFKARLEQEIKSLFEDGEKLYELKFGDNYEAVTVQKYFSHQIDTEWTNLFWQYKNEKKSENESLIDDKILNFIKVLFINHLAKNNLTDFVKSYRNEKHISFLEYKETKVLDKEFIKNVIAVLDVLKNGNKKIELRLGADSFYYKEAKEFEKCLDGSFRLREFIQFYAYYEYLTHWQSNDGLNEWMRIIHNLTTNVDYNNEQEFLRAFNGVSSLITVSNRIVSHFKDNGKVTGFNEKQIKEERIKAALFDKSHWKEAIKKIEQHDYFTGQIGFLLNFAGIEDYYDNHHNNCNWSAENDVLFLNNFNNYATKANSIFGNTGLKEFKDYAWQRALLTKGDYLLHAKGNWSFLIDVNRDISWKRLLFGDDYRKNKRLAVKDLFDDSRFDITNIQGYLDIIINEGKTTITDYRKYFLMNSKLLSYMGSNKYIRWSTDEEVYLLKGERTSGRHSELRTLFAYYEQFENIALKPFIIKYRSAIGNNYMPYFYFNGWHKYEIHVYHYKKEEKKEAKFHIRFYDLNEDNEGIDVQSVLDNNDFKLEEDYHTISSSLKNLKSKLEIICADLNALVQ